jgi:hypothetical protein
VIKSSRFTHFKIQSSQFEVFIVSFIGAIVFVCMVSVLEFTGVLFTGVLFTIVTGSFLISSTFGVLFTHVLTETVGLLDGVVLLVVTFTSSFLVSFTSGEIFFQAILSK